MAPTSSSVYMYSFWKRNHIFKIFRNAMSSKCVPSIKPARVNGSLEILWNMCSTPGFDLLPEFSLDNWIIIGTRQNQNRKPCTPLHVFIVVISMICKNIKTLVFKLFIIEKIFNKYNTKRLPGLWAVRMTGFLFF